MLGLLYASEPFAISWSYFTAMSAWSALNWTTSWSVWIVRTGMVELDALTPGPKLGFARYALRSRLNPKPSTDVQGAVPGRAGCLAGGRVARGEATAERAEGGLVWKVA